MSLDCSAHQPFAESGLAHLIRVSLMASPSLDIHVGKSAAGAQVCFALLQAAQHSR